MYVTNYRTGNNAGKSEDTLAAELCAVAAVGGDIFDVPGDLFALAPDQMTKEPAAILRQRELIETLHSFGKRVLMSAHTYRFMEYEAVRDILLEQRARGADIGKIVTAADSEGELYQNLATSARLKAELDFPFLFLCVGDCCKPHRRLAPLITGGMFLCVAERDELATRVQPTLAEVTALLQTGEKLWN